MTLEAMNGIHDATRGKASAWLLTETAQGMSEYKAGLQLQAIAWEENYPGKACDAVFYNKVGAIVAGVADKDMDYGTVNTAEWIAFMVRCGEPFITSWYERGRSQDEMVNICADLILASDYFADNIDKYAAKRVYCTECGNNVGDEDEPKCFACCGKVSQPGEIDRVRGIEI
jgi:hypothetical protein